MIRGTNDAPYRTTCCSASRQNCSVFNPFPPSLDDCCHLVTAARTFLTARNFAGNSSGKERSALIFGALAVLHLGEVVVVERHISLVAAGQHVDRVLDLLGFFVALAGVSAVALLAQVDLLALERRGVCEFLHHPD